jgi:hypothetical protein
MTDTDTGRQPPEEPPTIGEDQTSRAEDSTGHGDGPASGSEQDLAGPQTENPYDTTVAEEDPTGQYESPLTRSGAGPYPETERASKPGDPAVGGMD